MRARVRPITTRKADETTVMKQWYIEYFWIAGAITPPEEEATVRVTTGSNHLEDMVSRECFCFVILGQGQRKFNESGLLRASLHCVNAYPAAKCRYDNIEPPDCPNEI
jgi:hypothetical protein